MTEYKIRIKTVKQYLFGGSSILRINASNKPKAEAKADDIMSILSHNIDDKSVYAIYTYEFI